MAAEVIRGERLFASDDYGTDEYELYILRRAGDLAPLERERIALLNEPEKPRIVELTSGASLIAPSCVPWEIGNALSAMLKRGRLATKIARMAFSAFEEIPIRYVPVEFGNALQLSGDHGLYAYDAYYLDCAHRHHSPLLTLDKRLRQVATALAIVTPKL